MNEKEKYPFEVLFTDGSRSWLPKENSTPWGIILENEAVALQTPLMGLDFYHAQHYCSKIKVGNFGATCGEKAFWEKFSQLNRSAINKMNEFILSLNGIPIEKDYWTADSVKRERTKAWYMSFDEPEIFNADKKYKKHGVRGVIKIM